MIRFLEWFATPWEEKWSDFDQIEPWWATRLEAWIDTKLFQPLARLILNHR